MLIAFACLSHDFHSVVPYFSFVRATTSSRSDAFIPVYRGFVRLLHIPSVVSSMNSFARSDLFFVFCTTIFVRPFIFFCFVRLCTCLSVLFVRLFVCTVCSFVCLVVRFGDALLGRVRFVRFANMLINDSIYHMDEAIKYLSAIKIAQVGDWGANHNTWPPCGARLCFASNADWICCIISRADNHSPWPPKMQTQICRPENTHKPTSDGPVGVVAYCCSQHSSHKELNISARNMNLTKNKWFARPDQHCSALVVVVYQKRSIQGESIIL